MIRAIVWSQKAAHSCMVHIFSSRNPFKIFYAVVMFISVNMIDFRLVFGIRNESFCYQCMNCGMVCMPVRAHSYISIASASDLPVMAFHNRFRAIARFSIRSHERRCNSFQSSFVAHLKDSVAEFFYDLPFFTWKIFNFLFYVYYAFLFLRHDTPSFLIDIFSEEACHGIGCYPDTFVSGP